MAVYFQEYLGFSEAVATASVHAFVFFAYASTLLGGWLSDSYWAKYKTIVNFGLVYVLGEYLLSLTAYPGVMGDPPHWSGAALSLLLLALGTGGIKATVSAFLGDQFPDGDLDGVFFAFYFAINFGSFFSTLLTPLLAAYYGYWTAYLQSALLLSVAMAIFVFGSRLYIRTPPAGSCFICMKGINAFTADRRLAFSCVQRHSPRAALQLTPTQW